MLPFDTPFRVTIAILSSLLSLELKLDSLLAAGGLHSTFRLAAAETAGVGLAVAERDGEAEDAPTLPPKTELNFDVINAAASLGLLLFIAFALDTVSGRETLHI